MLRRDNAPGVTATAFCNLLFHTGDRGGRPRRAIRTSTVGRRIAPRPEENTSWWKSRAPARHPGSSNRGRPRLLSEFSYNEAMIAVVAKTGGWLIRGRGCKRSAWACAVPSHIRLRDFDLRDPGA